MLNTNRRRIDVTDAVQGLQEAQCALALLSTQEALGHLDASLRFLQGVAITLQQGERLPAPETIRLKAQLQHFRAELRSAGALTENGLALCRATAEESQPPAAYQANGAFARPPMEPTEVSLEA